MFRAIKLYFTDRQYYRQWKRHMKRQKAFRKELKKQAKEFCPWSGWYMHKMIKTMLEFYHKTYRAQDCCWSEESRLDKIADQLEEAIHWSEALDQLDDLKDTELIDIAQKDKAFEKYVVSKGLSMEEAKNPTALLAGLAEEYLNNKYTKAMYKVIGEHIWDWCD